MKYVLYTDYLKNFRLNVHKFSAKSLAEAGKYCEEFIDNIPQTERETIYCFTLENNKQQTIGRWRLYKITIEDIAYTMFGFHFGE